MNKEVHKTDCILALGSHDVRIAHRAAQLFNEGFAPYIVFSGGFGRLTGAFPKAEAKIPAPEPIKNTNKSWCFFFCSQCYLAVRICDISVSLQ